MRDFYIMTLPVLDLAGSKNPHPPSLWTVLIVTMIEKRIRANFSMLGGGTQKRNRALWIIRASKSLTCFACFNALKIIMDVVALHSGWMFVRGDARRPRSCIFTGCVAFQEVLIDARKYVMSPMLDTTHVFLQESLSRLPIDDHVAQSDLAFDTRWSFIGTPKHQ